MKSNFIQRTITSAIFAGVLIGATLAHTYSFLVLVFAINMLCLNEFYELVLPDKSKLEKYLGIGAGSIIYLMFAFIFTANLSLAWYYHIIPILLLLFVVKLFENSNKEFSTLAYQLLGMCYITLPLVMYTKLGFLNALIYSPGIPMGFFLLLWTADTGAYLAGRTFGKHKLFERVSPKKTWEGSVGALLLVTIVGYAISFVFDDLTATNWMVVAVLILVFSTFGDLFESLLKRNLQIKDSGSLLPGHGGVLDRFDGLFLAAPAVFFYLMLIN
jgi:phosphatidate cytidylyltransferase